MEQLRYYTGVLISRARSSETVGPILFAVTIGAGAGGAAILFRRLISLMQWLFQGQLGGALAGWIGGLWTIPVLALGGLCVGLITRYFAPETKGHGVPEVMLSVAQEGGRIRPRVTLLKAVAAAICIGSGGSAGREGPIVQIGSAFGSMIGQWFRMPDRRVILSVACGAAGGIAATFNAPMAGVIFALEVILARFTALSFGLVVMSSATATVVARTFGEEGDSPAFALVQEHAMMGVPDLLFFIVLGVLCAFVAQFYTRALYAIEDISDRVTIPEALKPAIGGAVVGALALGAPEIMGTGYQTIEAALNDNLVMSTLFILCFAKVAGTCMTIGTGGSGGIFAPSLFIGAMFGGGFGSLLNAQFPGLVSSPGAFALVGMAAVFAGAAHAPVTSIFILFEMTDDYRIIIPLMSATVVCTFVSRALSPESIYSIKLKRRGIQLAGAQDVNLMDAVTVGEAMTDYVDAVPPNMPAAELVDKLNREHETGYPVLDPDRNLVGVVTMRDAEEALLSGKDLDTLTVDNICTHNVIVARPDQTLGQALAQFGAHNVGRLPVIDPHKPRRIVGMLTRSDVVNAYTEAHQHHREMASRADALSQLRDRGGMVIERAQVATASPLAQALVRDAHFPEDSVLGAIRRAHQTVVPTGSTRILPGDELVVLTTRERAPEVRKWLRAQT